MKKLISILTVATLVMSGSGCKSLDTKKDDTPIKIDKAQEILDNMTLEEKVGQMFFARYPDDKTAPTDAKKYNLGGYILFSKDFKDKTTDKVVSQINACQAESKIPMFIGVDEEGGLVNRISKYKALAPEPFKSPQELYEEGGYELIREDTAKKCKLLNSLGVNINLGPVCDVSTDPSAFIYGRTFGKNAEITSEYTETVVSEMQKYRIGCSLKHFPGYGNNADTHTDIVTDTRQLELYQKNDFLPFKTGVNAGAEMIMVAHIFVESVDKKYPASLSPEMHQIIRDEICFNGLIMTDDLSMDAITQYTDGSSAAIQAVKAGNDLLCCTDYYVQIPAVIDAVKRGEIKESQIDKSVKRILDTKIKLGLIE